MSGMSGLFWTALSAFPKIFRHGQQGERTGGGCYAQVRGEPAERITDNADHFSVPDPSDPKKLFTELATWIIGASVC